MSAGKVSKIRLLGDWQHATRIAFVEFVNADSAKLALGCSGALLGLLWPCLSSRSLSHAQAVSPKKGCLYQQDCLVDQLHRQWAILLWLGKGHL